MRAPPPIAQVERFLQQSVRDHLILRGRGDDELTGGFIVGMVHGRQPLVGFVGPVHAEECAVAELVLGELQAVGGNAAVLNGIFAQVTAFGAAPNEIVRRSFRCANCAAAPPEVTAETVIPFPFAVDAKSSHNEVAPSFANRTETVVSPAISSFSSLSTTRKM